VTVITLIIDGPPVPKARPRVTKRGVYTPLKSASYERTVGWIAKAQMKWAGPMLGLYAWRSDREQTIFATGPDIRSRPTNLGLSIYKELVPPSSGQ